MTLNPLSKYRELSDACPRQARQYVEWFSSDSQALAGLAKGFEGKSILDLGCGLSYPHVVIFCCLGAEPIGVDIEVINPRSRIGSFLRLAKEFGLRQALRDGLVVAMLNKALSRSICSEMGVAKTPAQFDVRFGNALNLDFPDETFDIVYSHAVFEHIPDVGRGIDEIRRVLVPGGVARLAIHLYPCLTGGHTGKIGRPGYHVPPWDHLRERQVPPTSYLNELRESDYRREIEGRLEIVKWTLSRREQDAELLTADIERELAAKGYSRDELLSETLVVHAVKSSPDTEN